MAWVADFETITRAPTRVWGWGACEVGDEETREKTYIDGETLEDFLLWCTDKKKVFFHNQKFDGTFIIYWLLTHGWRESKSRKPKTFDLLMSAGGQVYSMKLYFSKGKSVTFIDSFKKFRMSVDRLARTFGMETLKGSIDYTLDRPEGHELTEEEKAYIHNDVVIVAAALHTQFSQGLKKLTIGSDALEHYKSITPNFNNLFPSLDLAIDADLRRAYKGGWVYCNPDRQYPKPDVGHGYSLDVNSLFPSVMYYKQMPYGQPIFYEGEYQQNPDYPLYIAHIEADFTLKPDHVPTVQIKGNLRFAETEYIRDSNGFVELTMTSVDLELMFKHYVVHEIHYNYGYMFQASTDLFKSYIDYWMEIKRTSKGGKRELAKLMLNNLYGKFGTNPDKTTRTAILENGVVRYKVNPTEMGQAMYLPVAAFTTAWARFVTISAAQSLYHYFCYSDTDSLKLTDCTLDDIIKVVEIHDTELGKWALEGEFKRARFLRPKRYITESPDGEIECTCAGLSDSAKYMKFQDREGNDCKCLLVTFDNFKIGQVFRGKLTPKNVVGGVLLEPTTFELK